MDCRVLTLIAQNAIFLIATYARNISAVAIFNRHFRHVAHRLVRRGSTDTTTTIRMSDTGRGINTIVLPAPIDMALRNCASASGPRIMPTTTGAAGKSNRLHHGRVTGLNATVRLPLVQNSGNSA